MSFSWHAQNLPVFKYSRYLSLVISGVNDKLEWTKSRSNPAKCSIIWWISEIWWIVQQNSDQVQIKFDVYFLHVFNFILQLENIVRNLKMAVMAVPLKTDLKLKQNSYRVIK